MSWTDLGAIKTICYLRDKYHVSTFIETGTFRGINAEVQSKNFDYVLTCEKNEDYFNKAKERLKDYKNVIIFKDDSSEFLKRINQEKTILCYYLDAHFFVKGCKTNKERFVILQELEALKERKNSIIIIHDFKHFLGGICYDGIDLNMDLVRKPLLKVNPKFYFYTNTLEGCDPVKPFIKNIEEAGLNVDSETFDNIQYMWSAPRLLYRGILYCLPTKLSNKEMKQLNLINIK